MIPISIGVKSIILVGDHKQLPPSVGYWAAQKGYSESLFARMATKVNPFLLKIQYRSHPLIMDISSQLFYDGELESGVSAQDRPIPKGFPWNQNEAKEYLPVAFVHSPHVENDSEGVTKSNPKEGDLVVNIVKGFLGAGMKPKEIGVIAPYAGQNRYLKTQLKKLGVYGIEQNSVDAFQGREKEVIVFSATRSNSKRRLGFLADPRRFNVMHTRARRGLVVIGNRQTLVSDPTWAKWYEWIEKHNLQVYY